MKAGLYVHIPFCDKKCHYCDFNSWPDGSLPGGAVTTYFDRLCREAELLVPAAIEDSRVWREPGFGTLYLGGGTPSSVETAGLERLFATLSRWMDIRALCEVTIEANPESLTPEKIEVWKRLGIGRVSLGIQTFQPELLPILGRIHTLDRAEAAISLLARSGLKSWTFDLMYGLPGQTIERFLEGVRHAVGTGAPHLSLYGLTVETGTEFGRRQREGSLNAPDSDFQADCFEGAREILTGAGYVHYEISNFARPGHEAVHNSLYWRRVPYLALGAGAHGFWPCGNSSGNELRWSVPRPFDRYAKYVDALDEEGTVTGRLSPARQWCPDWTLVGQRQAIEESVFLGLRLLEKGVSPAELRERFGDDAASLEAGFSRAAGRGWIVPASEGRWRLAPASVLVSNRVITEILGA